MTVNQKERQKREKNLLLFLAENEKNSTGIPHTENTTILNIYVLLQQPHKAFFHLLAICFGVIVYILYLCFPLAADLPVH